GRHQRALADRAQQRLALEHDLLVQVRRHHRLVVREVALDEAREDQRALGLELDLRLLDGQRDRLVVLAQHLVEQVHRLRGDDDADVLLPLDLARRLALDVGEALAVARHHPHFLALDLEELAGEGVADDLRRHRELRLADHRAEVLGRDLDRGLVLEGRDRREVGGIDADDLEGGVGQFDVGEVAVGVDRDVLLARLAEDARHARGGKDERPFLLHLGRGDRQLEAELEVGARDLERAAALLLVGGELDARDGRDGGPLRDDHGGDRKRLVKLSPRALDLHRRIPRRTVYGISTLRWFWNDANYTKFGPNL